MEKQNLPLRLKPFYLTKKHGNMPDYFQSRLAELTLKHLTGSLTSQEKEELKNLLASSEQKQQLFDKLTNARYLLPEIAQLEDRNENLLWKRQRKRMSFKGKRVLIWQYATAAVLSAAILTGGFFYFKSNNKAGITKVSTEEDGNKKSPKKTNSLLKRKNMPAMLLDTVADGVIGKWDNKPIIKKDLEVAYPLSQTSDLEYLATVGDGYFQFRLPDSSQVELCGNSSIHIAENFNDTARSIELEGTAYFKIAPNKSKIFRIHKGRVTLEVLGTEFNVITNNDADMIQANLFAGSIRVSTPDGMKLLVPGDQAIIRISRINNKDAIQIIHNGAGGLNNSSIVFNKKDFAAALKEIAQYYGYDIRFKNPVPKTLVGTSIPRRPPIRSTLNLLASIWKFRYEITGQTIIVNP